MKKNGFTLVELMIVAAILIVLAILMISSINPTAQVNKGWDAQKKKDVNRIKVAFEEFNNDKGCYPAQDSQLVRDLLDRDNCKSNNVFDPWLKPWPCDPSGEPYMLVFEETSCPRWFKVLTHLDNTNDADIPNKLKSNPEFFKLGSGTVNYNATQVNYGSSSTNVNWSDYTLPAACTGNCYRFDGTCQQAPGNRCEGANCYRNTTCTPECQVFDCDSNNFPE